MAGSIATLAILWVSLQTIGLLGHSHSISTSKLPSLQNYLTSYNGKCLTLLRLMLREIFAERCKSRARALVLLIILLV